VRHAERSKTNENNHGLFEAGIYFKSPLACRMRVAFLKKAKPLKECFKTLHRLTRFRAPHKEVFQKINRKKFKNPHKKCGIEGKQMACVQSA